MVLTVHFPQGWNQEEFHPGKLQREFHLATQPFGHLKIIWDTHYMNNQNLSGNVFENGKPMCSLSESSAHYRAPFKHCRPSSDLPET